MDSLSNRFDVLREASFSSEEQETQLPITGIEDMKDWTMQDTASLGLSVCNEMNSYTASPMMFTMRLDRSSVRCEV